MAPINNIIRPEKPVYNRHKYGDKKYLWVICLIKIKKSEYSIVEINTKIFIDIDISFSFKINGIKRRIIPIIDINRDKIWCLNNSFFNIILEKIGKDNKKYNLFSKTILLIDKKSEITKKYNINDIAQKIKNIFRGLIFIISSLYIKSSFCALI